jgi:hypothetical protein
MTASASAGRRPSRSLAVAKFEGDNRGIVFFMNGDKACTSLLAPSEFLSMMDDVEHEELAGTPRPFRLRRCIIV